MNSPEIRDAVSRVRVKEDLIVITGGEPMAQSLAPLVFFLQRDLPCTKIQIETSGLHHQDLPESVDVVVSPKTPSINYAGHVTAWKYVIRADEVMDDGLPLFATQGRAINVPLARPTGVAPIYVQPCDEQDPEKNAANLAATLDVVRRFGHCLSIQMHKIVGVP